MAEAGLLTYVERLQDNPDFQAFMAEIEKEIAQKMDALVSQPVGTSAEKIEGLRGEIRFGLALVVKPARVHNQLIVRRREQVMVTSS
jgi:hypothetical protein